MSASPIQLPKIDSLHAYSNLPVYVVLGVQGSGTNLFSRILSRVFGFSVLRDHSFVFDAARRLGRRPTRSQVAREIETLTEHLRPSFLRSRGMIRGIRDVAPFDGIETVLQPAHVRSGAEFARLVYAYRAARVGARHLAIKSDDLWAHLDAIDEVLPERRVILLTRDFRDNVYSVTRKPFGPVDPVCAALYVKRRFAAYEAEYLRAGTNGYIVRFETLVERADEFVRAMTAWCGLDATEVTAGALRTIPIRPGRVGRWRAMPARAQRQSEALLQNELRTYGYPLAFADPQAPTTLELLASHACDVVGRVGQKTRKIGRSIDGRTLTTISGRF